METKIQSNPKNIIYVITKSNLGGAQKYVYELAVEAHKNGNNVSVIVGGGGALVEKLTAVGIDVHKLNHLKRDISLFNEFRTFFELIRIFRKVKPDVIHLNSSKAGGLGALAGQICGIKKIIFTIHGWAFNEDRNWLSKLAIKILYFTTIFLSDIAIAVSEETRKQARKIPCSFMIFNKIKVVKNGIGPIDFMSRATARQIFKDQYGVNDESFIIGTMAELHPIKGLIFLIRSAPAILEINPDVRFLIFGEGEQRKELESLIVDLSLQNKVILGGFLKEASTYLKGFDVFILSSLSEAMPFSVIEAGFAGLPIIATSVGGIPEIITNGENGLLIDSNSEKNIENAIKTLLENPISRENFSHKIHDFVKENYNLEKMYQNTFECYN